jgi:hypothetical protein
MPFGYPYSTWNSQSSCLHLPRTGITGLHYHIRTKV